MRGKMKQEPNEDAKLAMVSAVVAAFFTYRFLRLVSLLQAPVEAITYGIAGLLTGTVFGFFALARKKGRPNRRELVAILLLSPIGLLPAIIVWRCALLFAQSDDLSHLHVFRSAYGLMSCAGTTTGILISIAMRHLNRLHRRPG
jgi:hypothetical protein